MTQWLPQSFFFQIGAASNEPIPIPITAQCETIQLSWERGAGTGPDPVAPYYLEIFTSHYVFPFQVDAGSGLSTNFTVPFAPGTQYQICMWDSKGNSGGCQGIYTVYQPSTNTSQIPQCANMTYPATSLAVTSSAGEFSWPASCSQISFLPTSGTPPYTFTVAPALHPPQNITSIGQNGISWPVALQWGMPFFVSMADSTGLTWAYGPLHAGQGINNCLADLSGHVTTGTAIGGVVAGLVVGCMIAFAIGWWFDRARNNPQNISLKNTISPFLPPTPYRPQEPDHAQPLIGGSDYFTGRRDATYSSGQSHMTSGQPMNPEYGVEPFNASSTSAPNRQSDTASLMQSPTRHMSADVESLSSPARRGGSQVYVVHHDRGPAPVSIYTQDGTEVVELPPIYARPPARGQSSSQDLRSPLTPSRRQPSYHDMRRQPSSQELLDPFTPVRSSRQPSTQSLRDSRQPSNQSLRESYVSYVAPSPPSVPTLSFPIPPGRRTLSSDKPEKTPIAEEESRPGPSS